MLKRAEAEPAFSGSMPAVAMAQTSQTAPTPAEQTDGVYQMVQEGVVREAQLHVTIVHLTAQVSALTAQVKDLTAKLAAADAKATKTPEGAPAKP